MKNDAAAAEAIKALNEIHHALETAMPKIERSMPALLRSRSDDDDNDLYELAQAIMRASLAMLMSTGTILCIAATPETVQELQKLIAASGDLKVGPFANDLCDIVKRQVAEFTEALLSAPGVH